MVTASESAACAFSTSPRGLRADDWSGRPVTVMGLGTHGGGVGAVRFLADHGARITLTDGRSADALRQPLAQLSDVRFDRLELGQHSERSFLDAEAVVVNPAVRLDHPLLQRVRSEGIPITTEVGLLWQHTTAPVVAVTGSVGKSTTVSMIDAILRAGKRRSWLGGNIGGSLLSQTAAIGADDWLVLELSSFQLASLGAIGFRPEIAVITNFSANHLDWHGSLKHYRDCKQQLLRHQTPGDIAILNSDDRDVAGWPTKGRVASFGTTADSQVGRNVEEHVRVTVDGIVAMGFRQRFEADWSAMPNVRGVAMQQNAAAAIAACLSLGVEPEAIVSGLGTFTSLPHRFEDLGLIAGRRWINDSKATTPAAAEAAIAACRDRPWVLLGGSGKNVDLRTFCETTAHQIRGAALMGETSSQMQACLRDINPDLAVHCCRSMSEAVSWLAQSSAPGDTVLLSPACASLDQFRDYADRGERFREAVSKLNCLQPTTVQPAA